MTAVYSSMSLSTMDKEIRVDDFLNDKLQNFADFDTLDSLISRVQSQHALLKQQLEDADRDLQNAKNASQDQKATIQLEYESFNKQQEDIDRRLQVMTRSDSIEEAARRFAPPMEQLRKLGIADGYIETLLHVEALRLEADESITTHPENALQAYSQLRKAYTNIQSLQETAEGAAPHLLDHFKTTTSQLRLRIRETLAAELTDVLGKLLWPKPNVAIPEALLPSWNRTVGRLLQLQRPDLVAEQKYGKTQIPNEHQVLIPLEIMVKPLELRFRYHFDGDRPTNRLDKPEFFLSHVLDSISAYSPFVSDYLQPALSENFKETDLSLQPAFFDATSALIIALLPMLRVKIFSLLPRIAKQPQLLSHFMHELMSFDVTLRTEWQYFPSENADWKGLTHEVLVTHSWFDHWLNVEKEFALSRYQSIVEATDSGELDYDTVAANSTKPTKAAIRVNDLLETITDRYRPLPSFSQKLRFLIDIQINIFDRFHQRLHSALEAFLSKTSSIGRTVQGTSAAELVLLSGVGGIDRLCRVHGSADYLEKAMRDWSDDPFFLDLWVELQTRTRNQPTSGRNFAGTLSVKDVAERTSAAVGVEDAEDAEIGALFDETAAAYRRLRTRTEGIIVDRLNNELKEALRPYFRINPWASLSSVSSGEQPIEAPTPDLAGLLSMLSSTLAFLKKTLAPLPLRKIGRHMAKSVDGYLWDRVLRVHYFSTTGAAQFTTDVAAIEGVFEKWIGDSHGKVGMRRICEGASLLNLPVTSSTSQSSKATEDAEDAWEMDVAEESQDKKLGLWEVEKRVFQDNESAREVLEELGFEILTETDAREVLERRVELGS